jgi:Ca2+-binding EF-hand superfamily protein
MDSTRTFFEKELKKKLLMKASGYTTEENILIKAFKYFDLDNTGLCNEREFIQTIQKIGISGFSDENLSQIFKFYDKDNSGKISYKEFTGILFNNQTILNEEKKIQSQKNNELNEKEEDIKNNEIIELTRYNNIEKKNEDILIRIDDSRRRYTNSEIDISI